MLRFHSDKKQVFECKVQVEGAELKETSVRLVLQDGNINRIYEGKLDVLGNCAVQLPSLDNFVNPTGKATLEVRVNNVVFEPFRSEYQIIKKQVAVQEVNIKEVKVIDDKPKPKAKKQMVRIVEEPKQKVVEMSDKKMIMEMLDKFAKLPVKHKKALKEYIEFDYEPSGKVKVWAEKRFNDLDTLPAKIVMFEVEKIIQ